MNQRIVFRCRAIYLILLFIVLFALVLGMISLSKQREWFALVIFTPLFCYLSFAFLDAIFYKVILADKLLHEFRLGKKICEVNLQDITQLREEKTRFVLGTTRGPKYWMAIVIAAPGIKWYKKKINFFINPIENLIRRSSTLPEWSPIFPINNKRFIREINKI